MSEARLTHILGGLVELIQFLTNENRRLREERDAAVENKPKVVYPVYPTNHHLQSESANIPYDIDVSTYINMVRKHYV